MRQEQWSPSPFTSRALQIFKKQTEQTQFCNKWRWGRGFGLDFGLDFGLGFGRFAHSRAGGFTHLEAESYTSNICAVLCARGALVILRRQKRPHRLQGSPDTTCYALLPDRSTYQFIKSYSLFNIQKPLAISDNCWQSKKNVTISHLSILSFRAYMRLLSLLIQSRFCAERCFLFHVPPCRTFTPSHFLLKYLIV